MTAPVVPPCPSWCTLTAGHDYTCGSDEQRLDERMHVAYAGRYVEVSAVEQNADGALWLTDPAIYAGLLNDGVSCSADQARALAAELLEAAAVVDRLNDNL